MDCCQHLILNSLDRLLWFETKISAYLDVPSVLPLVGPQNYHSTPDVKNSLLSIFFNSYHLMLKKNDDKHLKINLCLESVTGKLDSGCCCFSQSFWKDFKFSVATLSNVNGHST